MIRRTLLGLGLTLISGLGRASAARAEGPTTNRSSVIYSDTLLHGDGSITYRDPRVAYGERLYPVRAADASIVCRLLYFDEVFGITRETSGHDQTVAVGFTRDARALPPAPCDEVIGSVTCGYAGVETGRSFPP